MTGSIELTPQALQHFKNSLASQPKAIGIRLGLKEAGCSGKTYTIDFAVEKKDNEHELVAQDIRFFVAHVDLPNFFGMQIDYQKKDLNAQLIFNNPNVISACGCGESVSFKSKD